MVATPMQDAKSHGTDIMLTACPLCHLDLDGMQSQSASYKHATLNLPMLHLLHPLGLTMDLKSIILGLQRNLFSHNR